MNRAFLFVFCSTFLVTLAFAYDWSDSDFNVILQNDYLEHMDLLENDDAEFESNHIRIARQASRPEQPTTSTTTSTTTENCKTPPTRPNPTDPPGNNRYQRFCCGDRDDLKMHGDALKELRKDCFTEVRRNRGMKASKDQLFNMFDCRNIEKSKDDLICAMECIARKKNLIDNQGYMLRENSTNFVKEELVNAEWQLKIIDKILEKCLGDADNHSAIDGWGISPNDTSSTSTNTPPIALEFDTNVTRDRCNPSALRFSHCMWREMQLSCPSDQMKDSRNCERMRERLQKKEYPDFTSGRPRPPINNNNYNNRNQGQNQNNNNNNNNNNSNGNQQPKQNNNDYSNKTQEQDQKSNNTNQNQNQQNKNNNENRNKS